MHMFEDCADKSERPDVRTIIEEALPCEVLEWLRTMRNHHLGPDLRNLLSEIGKHKVDKQVIEQRLMQFKLRMDVEALLPACCCCGIRDDYVPQGDLEFIGAKEKRRPAAKQQKKGTSSMAFSLPAEDPDLYAQAGQKKSSYVKVHVCFVCKSIF